MDYDQERLAMFPNGLRGRPRVGPGPMLPDVLSNPRSDQSRGIVIEHKLLQHQNRDVQALHPIMVQMAGSWPSGE